MTSERRRAAAVDAVSQGAVFGVAMGLAVKLSDHDGWARAGVVCLIAGVVYGALSIFWTRRRREERFHLLVDLTAAQRKEVLHAAERGKVPGDVLLRTRAAALARLSQREALRWRAATTVIIGLAVLANVVVALTSSPWWWLSMPGVGAALIINWGSPQRLERRIQLLRV
ncbi:MAG: hypothetical protein ACRDVG_05665 [Jatrophihabitantaceae bacterium]